MTQDTRVDELRRARDSYAVVLRSILREHADDPNRIFCLIEGRDGAFYRPIVMHEFSALIDRHQVDFKNCSGKANVAETYKAIKSNISLNSILLIALVDRDFDEGLDDFDTRDTWVTERHSIENYYTSDRVFREIFKEVFMKDAINTESDKSLLRNVISTYSKGNRSITLPSNHSIFGFGRIADHQKGKLNLGYYEQHPPEEVNYTSITKKITTSMILTLVR